MDDENVPSQEQDGIAGEVNESLGVSDDGAGDEETHDEPNQNKPSAETLSVQKRLKSQKRAHEREVRELHARISDMESRMTQPNSMSQHQSSDQNAMPTGAGGNDLDGTIHKAVQIALQHKDNEARKQREAESHAHVQKEYQDFHKHLDSMNDKYDDFHDVVYGSDTPYTEAMRDYALTLPRNGKGSAGEVLYHLGKPENRETLDKIRTLHPLKQASELAKLSHALNSGGEQNGSHTKAPMGNIKTNPVSNSHTVTDKTPIGSIRERMKSGTWK